MKKRFSFIMLCLVFILKIYAQSGILIVDPFHEFGASLTDSLSYVYPGSITTVDSIPKNISSYSAAFIFLQGNSSQKYIISKEEGESIINYLNNNGNVYFYGIFSLTNADSAGLLNYLGIQNGIIGLPLVTNINYYEGNSGTSFSKVFINKSTTYGGAEYIRDTTVKPVIEAKGSPLSFPITYIPVNDSIKAVIDLFYFASYKSYLNALLYNYFSFPIEDVKNGLNKSNTHYTLFQNYPNPFNPSTTIRYEIPKENIVTIKIFNILGKEIATILNSTQNVGSHQVEWKAKNFPSGIYFYQVRAGKFISTKKMLLIK